MTILYLVRHGKTDYSGKQLCGNIPGIHLNQIGIDQAERIASFFEKIPVESIFSSPLERAIETARPTAKQKSILIEKVDFLREIDFGDYQGKGAELQQDPLWNNFLARPTSVQFPNGETVSQAQKRVVEGLNDVCRSSSDADEIMCVAHCEIIRLAIAHALNMPLDDYVKLTIDTGYISKLVWQENYQKMHFLNLCPL